MAQGGEPWVVVATFGAAWEADFAAETLREAGIPAHVDRGPGVGIFGAGYQGLTQFGVRVRVPWHRERDARDLLEDEPLDGGAVDSDPLPEAS